MTQRRADAAYSAPAGLDHYDFFANAIAGRRVALQRASENHDLAYSDGQSIFLPWSCEDGGLASATIAAQACLIGAGSLHPSILGLLVGRPSVAQRYLYLEMLRAVHVLAYRLPWAFTEKVELRRPQLTDSPRSSLKLAASEADLPEPPAYFGKLRPFLAVRAAVGSLGLAALSHQQQPAPMIRADVPVLDDDDKGEESELLRWFQNPFSAGNPLADLLNNILGAGLSRQQRDTEGGNSGGAELRVSRVERAVKRGVNALLTKFPIKRQDLDLAASPAFVYPEWNAHARAYQHEWVFVEETEPWCEDARQEFGNLLGNAPAELRRQLCGLGVDQETHSRQNDGSDLDLDALIECAIELRAGYSPPSLQVYRSSRRTRRDLAVTLMVDISGSTGERQHDGDSIFNKQLKVAYQLGQVLDSLGDTVAMFGFHSWGRKRVRVVRIKSPLKRWSLRVAKQMALLEPLGYTRIGAAIRHATHVLNADMRLPNRLMVLVTDGIAYDQDYELSYAAADANRALAEAREAGTACVCLSVGASTSTEKLQEVFGAANILAVNEVSQLTGLIREVCRDALAAVSKRRFGPVSRRTQSTAQNFTAPVMP